MSHVRLRLHLRGPCSCEGCEEVVIRIMFEKRLSSRKALEESAELNVKVTQYSLAGC